MYLRDIDICIERDRLVSFQKRFESGSFSLKINLLTFEYKIHSVEVDLYYFKYL